MIGAVPGRCRFCQQPLLAGSGGDICDTPVCITRSRVQQASQLGLTAVARRDRLEQQADDRVGEILEGLARKLGADSRADIPTTITPYIAPPEVERDADVILDFVRHLTKLVTQVFAGMPIDVNSGNVISDTPPGDAAARPDDDTTFMASAVLSAPDMDVDVETAFADRDREAQDDPLSLVAACIACGGNCCTTGLRHHAYLHAIDIAYYRHHRPDATPAEIIADYLSRIPRKSLVQSCLYLSDRGCTLPRDLRSTTCNRWQCGARIDLARQIKRMGPERSVVIGLAKDHADFPEEGASQFRVVTVSDGTVQIHDELRLPALSPVDKSS